MFLKDTYYQVTDVHTEAAHSVFRIVLLPGCDVYRGHFPGHPVCPGACNMEVVRECAMMLTGKKLRISTIRQCRLTAIVMPDACTEVDLTLGVELVEQGFRVVARMTKNGKLYMEYKGEMMAVQS